MDTQTAPPGEARIDKNPEELLFNWLSLTAKIIRIKAGLIVSTTGAFDALEEKLETLPDGEERRGLIVDLERRYTGLMRFWLDGFESRQEEGPEAAQTQTNTT